MAPPREVAPAFEREQGCTEAEWLRWLPGAVGAHRLERPRPGAAVVTVGSGTLRLDWDVLPPRRIALISMPRMTLRFGFDAVDAPARAEFMRYFDLYLQRGGG